MADWQRQIYLQPEWDQRKRDEITIQALARVVADRLKACAPFDVDEYKHGIDGNAAWANNRREELIAEFEGMAGDPTLTTDEFDSVMVDLYDWGDTPFTTGSMAHKACFIDWVSSRDVPAKATP